MSTPCLPILFYFCPLVNDSYYVSTHECLMSPDTHTSSHERLMSLSWKNRHAHTRLTDGELSRHGWRSTPDQVVFRFS